MVLTKRHVHHTNEANRYKTDLAFLSRPAVDDQWSRSELNSVTQHLETKTEKQEAYSHPADQIQNPQSRTAL